MIVLDDIQRGWRLIDTATEEHRAPAQMLHTVTTPTGQPLLVIDRDQQRHFLIPISGQRHPRGDQQSAGIHLLVNEWGIDGTQQWYADLLCLKPHLNDVFDLIIYDICKDLQENRAHPVDVCRRVLDQWRELLSHDSAGIPDLPTLLGLFGELWVLRELTRQQRRAVELWLGPTGARHDFSNGSIAIEVKASQQRRGRLITIHGHDQLDAPANGSLYLALLQLEEVPSGGEAVPDLVQELTALGCDQYELLRRLARLNITQETLAAVSNMRFRVLTTNIYRVDDSFPRITSSSFVGGRLPNGVIGLTYQIDVSSAPPYPIQPGDVAALYSDLTATLNDETTT
jgi:hypothetical protein